MHCIPLPLYLWFVPYIIHLGCPNYLYSSLLPITFLPILNWPTDLLLLTPPSLEMHHRRPSSHSSTPQVTRESSTSIKQRHNFITRLPLMEVIKVHKWLLRTGIGVGLAPWKTATAQLIGMNAPQSKVLILYLFICCCSS